MDSIIINNTGYAIEGSTARIGQFCRQLATFNNSGGVFENTPQINIKQLVLSSNPFVNISNDDYRLNKHLSILKGMSFPIYGQLDNRDIGALQHQERNKNLNLAGGMSE